jgi:hypothetical protein
MDVERLPDGHEHVHAVLRDRTGTRGLELDTDGTCIMSEMGGSTTEPVTGTRGPEMGNKIISDTMETTATPMGDAEVDEKIARKEKRRKEKEMRERMKEPVYRPLGAALPPPRSERYAAPRAPSEIERTARERFEKKFQPTQPAQMPGWRG